MSTKREVLAANPLFSYLSPEELGAVENIFEEVSATKGKVVCRTGDDGDAFYIIMSGELAVYGRVDSDEPSGYLGRGSFFGEMSLLQGGKRTATVIVSQRARLLVLNKTAFDEYFAANPKALAYFSQVLIQRLINAQRGSGPRKQTTTISVASHPGLKGTTLVAASLATIIKNLTHRDVLLVRVRPTGSTASRGQEVSRLANGELLAGSGWSPSFIDLELDAGIGRAAFGERLSDILADWTERFPYIVFDLDWRSRDLIGSAEEFSDFFVEIARSADAEGYVGDWAATKRPRIFRLLNLYNEATKPIPISECEPFVLPTEGALVNVSARQQADWVRTHPRLGASLPLHRLARKVLGMSVGIALGGGAAFGVSHIGVLKVLEENGIPIDLISGCSMGSMVALSYAAGVTIPELVDIVKLLGRRDKLLSTTLADFTLTKPGILGGDRIKGFFRPVVGGTETFDQLAIPCKAIATDIKSGERVSIGNGQLDAAFRASSAVPMVWAPAKRGDRTLVDGGVVDPVPAEVVRSMGADIVIAVNVIPPLKVGVETAIARTLQAVNRYNPLSYIGKHEDLGNMFDIIMNSMQVLQYELGNYKAASADVLINPDLRDFTWVEYHRSEELIAKGVEAAEAKLPAIQHVFEKRFIRAGGIVPTPETTPAPALAAAGR